MEATQTMIHAFVTTKLYFMNALLTGLPKNLIQKLQKIKNIAAQIVTKSKSREHITPILKELHWLPIEQRIEFKILVVTYKALKGLAPQYITGLLTPYTPSRG
jgi:hypothetical protein